MAAAMVALANLTLGSAQSTVSFSSIPTTGYRDLRLVVSIKHTNSGRYTHFRVNGDSGSNYSAVQMFGDGSSAQSASYSASTRFVLANNYFESNTEAILGTIDFLDYQATDKHKSVLWRSGLAGTVVNASAGRWASTSAITSIVLDSTEAGSNTFAAGSTFSLFGIVSA